MINIAICNNCKHFSRDDVLHIAGHCKLTGWARFGEETCSSFEEADPMTCSTCTYWACMNRKELIGACTIWHDSGKTWPKSWESCPHWQHDKRKEEKNDV